MLKHAKCVGIKIHPEEHGYHISGHAGKVYEFAASHQAIICTHTGGQNSHPEDFVEFADRFPEVKTILCHLGCTWDNDLSHQVRAVQASKHDNLYTDTSSRASLVSGLIEWAVKEIGAERILFGSDSPLYFAAAQRARIDKAEMDPKSKEFILARNAERLFHV